MTALPHPRPAAGAWLLGLTAEQRAAVQHGHGPLRVFAGPGSGKTRTITHRIAHLLATGQARPSDILAITFTVRAAGEMRLRLIDLLGEHAAAGLMVKTFHSVCAQMIRAHPEYCGRRADFTIYDQEETEKVIDACLAEPRSPEIAAAVQRVGEAPKGEVRSEMSLAKNRGLDAATYEQHGPHPCRELIAAVWREVDRELAASNALDFDDLLVLAVRLLTRPGLRSLYRQRWRWLLVDEYQDTSLVQSALLELLAGATGNVTVVGDDDQALYGWRAASVEEILRFDRAYPTATTVTLARNFRSKAEILGAASRCVAHNTRRVPKPLVAMRGGGGSAQVVAFAADELEADWVADTIAYYLAAGVSHTEIQVLIRSIGRGAHYVRPLEQALHERAIAHRILGALGLYERREVRDALAYLALAVNPYDAAALRRALATPARGCGATTIARLVAWSRERQLDLLTAAATADRLPFARTQRAREQLVLFGQQMLAVRSLHCAGQRSLAHIAGAALTIAGGLVASHQHRRDHGATTAVRQDAERVLEDLRSVLRACAAFEREHPDERSLGAFLEHVAGLGGEQLDGPDTRITISTIHRAKGTEAQVVFVLGCEDGLLPSWRSLELGDPDPVEEERRLFYVAATRAKDRLYLTHTRSRRGRETDGPSRFLHEAGLIPEPIPRRTR